MKCNLFTLYVNDYKPECRKRSFPAFERYAKKIGFEFYPIEKRMFPDLPPTYEKMQIHELGKDADWNIYIDADTELFEDFPSVIDYADCEKATFFYMFFSYLIFKSPLPGFEDCIHSPGAALVVSNKNSHDIWKPISGDLIESVKAQLFSPKHLDEACLFINAKKIGYKYLPYTFEMVNSSRFF